jgi:hypothetical protein
MLLHAGSESLRRHQGVLPVLTDDTMHMLV